MEEGVISDQANVSQTRDSQKLDVKLELVGVW